MTTGSTRGLLAIGLLAVACAGDPVAEVERRRADYSARVAGFLVRDDPAGGPPTVVLDLIVEGGSNPPLAGLTVDISIAGAAGAEKARRRVWIDTSRVGPGGEQIAVTLEGLDYVAGDGFWAEVRTPVPAAERGDYRELAEAGR